MVSLARGAASPFKMLFFVPRRARAAHDRQILQRSCFSSLGTSSNSASKNSKPYRW